MKKPKRITKVIDAATTILEVQISAPANATVTLPPHPLRAGKKGPLISTTELAALLSEPDVIVEDGVEWVPQEPKEYQHLSGDTLWMVAQNVNNSLWVVHRNDTRISAYSDSGSALRAEVRDLVPHGPRAVHARCVFTLAAARREERALELAHPDYAIYRARTPAIIPRLPWLDWRVL
jgi:hypothetical protein